MSSAAVRSSRALYPQARGEHVVAVRDRRGRVGTQRGLRPLPLGITAHKLRHTFASILVAIGRAPTYVMPQLEHTDPAFTLRLYSHTMRRSEDERKRLKALVESHVWAANGQQVRDCAPRARRASDV